MKHRPTIMGCFGVAFLTAIAIAAGTDYHRKHNPDLTLLAVEQAIEQGQSTGPLHQGRGQFLCFDQDDAMRVTLDHASDQGEAVMEHLTTDGRCTWSDEKSGYDMTSDGREHFATAAGSLDLWAATI